MIPAGSVNAVKPDINLGLTYNTDAYYVGFSTTHLTRPNMSFDVPGTSEYKSVVHYYLTGGYVFDLSSTLKFKPSLMFKGVTGAPVSIDINANFLMYDRFEVGASYRVEDSVSLLFNFGVTRSFRMGYAYDYTISDYSNSNTGGAHEIILLYDIDFAKKNLKSPRFF